ncbi:MAG TPA: hypothetical protein VK662_04615 [Acidothermaceae bacterium]|jgi:hypothetical protein|nr:hypothetical protein [Acidothermaceae bacterium]
MSQQPPDEEFERRLRDVLSSRGLGVPVPPDALDRVHAGARRRQQRRSAAAVFAGVAVIAVVAGAIGLSSGGGNGSTATASKRTPDTFAALSASTNPLVSTVPSSEAPAISSPAVAASTALPSPPSSAVPSVAPAIPTTYPSPGSAVPATFSPLSVSAISTKTFWVLGTQQCAQLSCTAIVQTTDGGSHFTEVAAPHAATITIDNSTRVVFGLRFADSDNGWAYGEALWTTSDGGATWTDTSLPAGAVHDLGAAHAPGAVAGTVWAVVQPSPFTSGYELWSAPYAPGTGTGAWQQVDLGSDPPGTSVPSLAVQGADAYLIAADAKNVTHLYVASSGVATTVLAAPCSPAGNDLSAGVGSLWTVCAPNGPKGALDAKVSTDGGKTWQNVVSSSSSYIGGVDAKTAFADNGSGLVKLSTSGQAQTLTSPQATNGFSFIGFTDAKTGFALSQPDPTRLWRTTDGGTTWSVVGF